MKTYELRLEASFPSVLREAEVLYEGAGILQQTYQRLVARLEALGRKFAAQLHPYVRRKFREVHESVRPDSKSQEKTETL